MKKLFNHLYVSGQITAADFDTLKSAGIKRIINNRPDGEEGGQMSSAEAAELAVEHGMDYHYLPMVNGQPVAPEMVTEFRSLITCDDAPVLAHCRSGMRSSFLWALGAIPAGEVDVEQAINAANSADIPLQNARAILESL